MKKTFIITALLLLSIALMLSSCGDAPKESTAGELPDASMVIKEIESTLDSAFSKVESLNAKPVPVEFENTDGMTVIELNDSVISIDGDGAAADGSALTITKHGTYLLSGTLTDGQIVINTQDTEKVKLILNGVSVSSTSCAVYIENAPKKVILYSVEGSVNLFSDGTDYIVPDEQQTEGIIYPNACIYSTADLKLDGGGEIYILSNCGKGINTKDDLEIESGRIFVNAKDDGIRGNDSVEILGGEITVIAGADGIKSANTDTDGKGYIKILGGSINVKSATDALQSATTLDITGGIFNLLCADGCIVENTLSEADMSSNARRPGMSGGGMGGPGGMPGGMGGMNEGNSQKPDYSCKAIKSTAQMTISGGSFTISTPDDAFHSDTALTINGGIFNIAAGDDGLHAENELTVNNGDIKIVTSYEGVEAVLITVNGGKMSVVARDDGFNACGGVSMSGGFPKGTSTPDTSDVIPTLAFNGGEVTVNAAGDGVDSNGNIIMTGGSVFVYGPTNNGNGAIDYGDGYYNMTISGGTFLAVGASGMAETAFGSGQGVIGVRMGNISAGSVLKITDTSDNTIIEFTTPKSMSSLVFSSANVKSGESYTVWVDSSELGTISAA